MLSFPITRFLEGYWQNSFHLKQHIQEFLNLDSETLEKKLEVSQKALAELGYRDFDWEKATEFYRDQVGEAYLFDLGIWHLTSQDYMRLYN
jgi:hypothetical protein